MTDQDARAERCSNPKCPLPRARSGPCAPEGWQDARAEAGRRWPDARTATGYSERLRAGFVAGDVRVAFRQGAEWARAAVLAEVREEVRKVLSGRKVKPFDGLAVPAVLDRAAEKADGNG